jgi:hypothetical protein
MTPPRISLRTIGSILAVLTAALTAYYSTVYGIRLTVNEKADRATVEQIDRRLVAIETVLKTDVANRNDMQALRDEVRTRLSRIETLLQKSHAANPNE